MLTPWSFLCIYTVDSCLVAITKRKLMKSVINNIKKTGSCDHYYTASTIGPIALQDRSSSAAKKSHLCLQSVLTGGSTVCG